MADKLSPDFCIYIMYRYLIVRLFHVKRIKGNMAIGFFIKVSGNKYVGLVIPVFSSTLIVRVGNIIETKPGHFHVYFFRSLFKVGDVVFIKVYGMPAIAGIF